jgi:hypothetical protein
MMKRVGAIEKIHPQKTLVLMVYCTTKNSILDRREPKMLINKFFISLEREKRIHDENKPLFVGKKNKRK